MDRKNFFQSGLRDLARELMKSPVGGAIDRQLHSLSNLLAPQWLDHSIPGKSAPGSPHLTGLQQFTHNLADDTGTPADEEEEEVFPRPPGALLEPGRFEKACTRCNDCILACPHGTLFNLGPYSGPVLNPNRTACHLCKDYPCIASCEAGALEPLPSRTVPKFGQAFVREDLCLNRSLPSPAEKSGGVPGSVAKPSPGKKPTVCKACVKVCPVPDAVRLNKAKFPEFAEHCTGCGLCIDACPARPRAIQVLW